MTAIVSRWEWRCFGAYCPVDALRRAALLGPPRDSREIYLVADRDDVNIKIRDGLLDVKVRDAVDYDGLEQWAPVVKSEFPLLKAAALTLCQRLYLPAPERVREAYDRDTFVDELAVHDLQLRVVDVRKRRTSGAFAGCRAEVAAVWFDGVPVETMALEHEDPARLLSALSTLGLAPHDNRNYIKALREFCASAPGASPAGTVAPAAQRQGGIP
jgi:hypothetical protein